MRAGCDPETAAHGRSHILCLPRFVRRSRVCVRPCLSSDGGHADCEYPASGPCAPPPPPPFTHPPTPPPPPPCAVHRNLLIQQRHGVWRVGAVTPAGPHCDHSKACGQHLAVTCTIHGSSAKDAVTTGERPVCRKLALGNGGSPACFGCLGPCTRVRVTPGSHVAVGRSAPFGGRCDCPALGAWLIPDTAFPPPESRLCRLTPSPTACPRVQNTLSLWATQVWRITWSASRMLTSSTS